MISSSGTTHIHGKLRALKKLEWQRKPAWADIDVRGDASFEQVAHKSERAAKAEAEKASKAADKAALKAATGEGSTASEAHQVVAVDATAGAIPKDAEPGSKKRGRPSLKKQKAKKAALRKAPRMDAQGQLTLEQDPDRDPGREPLTKYIDGVPYWRQETERVIELDTYLLHECMAFMVARGRLSAEWGSPAECEEYWGALDEDMWTPEPLRVPSLSSKISSVFPDDIMCQHDHWSPSAGPTTK